MKISEFAHRETVRNIEALDQALKQGGRYRGVTGLEETTFEKCPDLKSRYPHAHRFIQQESGSWRRPDYDATIQVVGESGAGCRPGYDATIQIVGESGAGCRPGYDATIQIVGESGAGSRPGYDATIQIVGESGVGSRPA